MPAALMIFGAVVLPAATATCADRPQQDVYASLQALNQRLEAQDKKILQLESRLTDEALRAARHEEIAGIMSEMRADASDREPLPQWLDNLKLFGDLRFRYEHRSSDGLQLRERNRYLFRLRVGFSKTWLDDQMEVYFRLASGANATGRSNNQTMDGWFSKKDVWIERAYARYSPKGIPGLTVLGGKIPNILEHTHLMFDPDINPDGFAVQYHRDLCGIEVFGNFAHTVLNEEWNTHDTILNVYQGGFRAPLPRGTKGVVSAAWYDYENYEDLGLTPADGVNGWNRDMKLVNVLARLEFQAFGLPWNVFGDWVHNTQDNDEVANFENADDGYAIGAKIGENKKTGDWSTIYRFEYIEYNAVSGVLNDTGFSTDGPGLGMTTNVKGHVLRATYNLTDFLIARGTIYFLQPITGDRDENKFMMRFDLMWEF